MLPAPTDKAQPAPVALFVSDIHLQPALPRTTEAFFAFLQTQASRAEQLFLLGDLFEYWAGDDDLIDSYNATVADRIRKISEAGVKVFWVGGNRDFLVGSAFAKAAGLQLLEEPFAITIGERRIALVHGDAQCTDDAGYMAFRAQVRQADWQRTFLAMPLAQRKAIIADMRTGSQEAQRSKSYGIMDVNPAAIDELFRRTGSSIIIHGHTHRPARHVYVDADNASSPRVRYVLPDWDCDTKPPRGGWIAVSADGAITRHGLDGTEED
ncbi:MAG TPA: UDP-2,3-diacylglucosamine diphosphatase [Noviherbaspirillum sp.]|uniref:UDP-2,3-diacylglucosamine diphosphatase n=1 Tax=Noviherbaspirillum sp. TaxID=1926288 RepID=UPI002DDCA369|nr:UDP-2,3-diacylglucosamine diphosphatase [Noviherbaspirillum sp.]HEV2612225.1 UDP-2,3-diacylglucosamine diphosphatase [Noviherbaspirillum sp.]